MNPNGAHQTDVKETTIETTQFQKPYVISFESCVYFMPDAKVTTTKLIKCYDIVSKRFVIVTSFSSCHRSDRRHTSVGDNSW